MAVRTRDDGADTLGPWFGLLYDAVVEGVRDYYRLYASTAAIHRVTTRRSIIRDHIVDRLRAGLVDERGVEVIGKHGTTLFGLASTFVMKAHLLNQKMMIALNDTQHSIRFNDNDSEPCLPGDDFSAPTMLYLGYVPNPDAPLEPKVHIVCPAGAEPAWHMELKRSEDASVIEVIQPRDDLDRETLVEVPHEIERKDVE